MFEYKFKFAVLHSNVQLSCDFLGWFQNGSADPFKKKFEWFIERKNYDYYYSPVFGPIQPEFWKVLLSDVVTLKVTLTEFAVKNNVPRSLFSWFSKHSEEFKAFKESREYRHFVGSFCNKHTKNEVRYGELINVRKTDRVRKSPDIGDRSYSRALNLCLKYNVSPEFSKDEWVGCHLSDGTIPYYNVKCNVCGTVFPNYFHCSTIRVCPQCKTSSFRAVREEFIAQYFRDCGYTVYCNSRTLLGYSYEIDVVVPDLHVAFECNGYYFHSSYSKDVDYHLLKTELCLGKGLYLYHIWEDMSQQELTRLLECVVNNMNPYRSSGFKRVPRDLCASPVLFTKWYPKFYLKSYTGPVCFAYYSALATSKYKAGTIVKDTSKFSECNQLGLDKVFNTGYYEFARIED